MISEHLNKFDTIFLDTTPIIYFIEAHPVYGDILKIIVEHFQSKKLTAFSSVVTITEQ